MCVRMHWFACISSVPRDADTFHVCVCIWCGVCNCVYVIPQLTDKHKPPNMTVTNDGVGVRNQLVLAVLGDCGCVAEAHADEEGVQGLASHMGWIGGGGICESVVWNIICSVPW